MKYVKVFLASSSELEYERIGIGDLFGDLNTFFEKEKKDIRVILLKWENFDASFSKVRKQEEYNYKVQDADIFIVLFHTIQGKYTQEEIEIAQTNYSVNNRPHLKAFFKKTKDDNSLSETKNKLIQEHFIVDDFTDLKNLRLQVAKVIEAHIAIKII